MKTKYMIMAGVAGLAAAVYFFKARKNENKTTAARQKKRSAEGEKHIRDVMKRSKLAIG